MWAMLIPALIGGLASAMAGFVGRAIIALGVGFVSYKGIDLGMDMLKTMVITSMRGLPVQMVNLLAYLWVDRAISVIFSGVAVALSFKAIGGTVKKMVWR